jgi:hypothetical protein
MLSVGTKKGKALRAAGTNIAQRVEKWPFEILLAPSPTRSVESGEASESS